MWNIGRRHRYMGMVCIFKEGDFEEMINEGDVTTRCCSETPAQAEGQSGSVGRGNRRPRSLRTWHLTCIDLPLLYFLVRIVL